MVTSPLQAVSAMPEIDAAGSPFRATPCSVRGKIEIVAVRNIQAAQSSRDVCYLRCVNRSWRLHGDHEGMLRATDVRTLALDTGALHMQGRHVCQRAAIRPGY